MEKYWKLDVVSAPASVVFMLDRDFGLFHSKELAESYGQLLAAEFDIGYAVYEELEESEYMGDPDEWDEE